MSKKSPNLVTLIDTLSVLHVNLAYFVFNIDALF